MLLCNYNYKFKHLPISEISSHTFLSVQSLFHTLLLILTLLVLHNISSNILYPIIPNTLYTYTSHSPQLYLCPLNFPFSPPLSLSPFLFLPSPIFLCPIYTHTHTSIYILPRPTRSHRPLRFSLIIQATLCCSLPLFLSFHPETGRMRTSHGEREREYCLRDEKTGARERERERRK